MTDEIAKLASDLAGLRQLVDERDKWYKERDHWYAARDRDRQAEVQKALESSDKQTAAAFASSKDAIAEAKKAQDSYNLTHNDLVRKMEQQASSMLTRATADEKFASLDEKIQDLKAVSALAAGRGVGIANSWTILLGAVALIASLVALWGFRGNAQIQYVPVQPGVSLPLTLAPNTVK
jgi:hypothetical protein